MNSKIKAIILDFDGIIISSKVAEYESWRRVFKVFNCHLTIKKWIKIIDNPMGEFDPASIIIKKCKYGEKFNHHDIQILRKHLYEDLRNSLNPLPGVVKLINECSKLGLLIGLASNGIHEQIKVHLIRLKLTSYFNSIKGRDDVENKKPAPDLYLALLKEFKITSSEAIVFEDSPPGIAAAKSADIYTIAVPNKITKYLNLQEADKICKSLKYFSMKDFLAKVAF